ncbi:DUF4270 domain-containing protein [Muriicola soli]|uniref:DUF4270 domain-containing protein n=1 Tax=Muriicola soli TaxID=2507538 RepID=A0A411EC13_9FLAO|nr:DUF4270 domain-containing protein [Muriicola soli]QBA65168.1 DUF4270 domain-containing protein [Muriicola soli]
MRFFLRGTVPALLGTLLLIAVSSCEEEVTTIGNGVIDQNPFVSDVALYDVFAYNRNVEAVQTNKLPIYQIGVFNDPLYGQTTASITTQVSLQGGIGNPTFGNYAQSTEDISDSDDIDATIEENERISEVILYIPYLRNNNADTDLDGVINEFDVDPEDPDSDSDGDGLSDNQERVSGSDPLNTDTDGDGIPDDEDTSTLPNRFPVKRDLDSIYGNRDLPFNFKVERSTYFLRDLDPNSNFLEAQEYYSSQEFAPSFVSDVLFDGEVLINNEQTLVFAEDDPDTEDDESLASPQVIEPGIRVALDSDFFQQNILDKEGKSELISNSNFQDFFRGLHLSVTPTTEDIMLLLDLRTASITITYEYDRIVDGEMETTERDYTISLITGQANSPISGNAVNTILTESYPTEISDNLDTGNNASRIYLKGGPGIFAEIALFEENNGEAIVNDIKSRNWIINEANLVFYVDRDALNAVGGIIEPFRLYMYNADTNAPVYNPANENNSADSRFGIYLDYDAILQEENDLGIKYKIRITDHINDLILRDSTNATLGLAISPDIRISGVASAVVEGNMDKDIPVGATLSPLSTVLFGSEADVPEEMKLKLEIFYTEPN